ncbi:MAG: hypothetical protein VB122_07585 [Erysipelotrichales bacterium]|nr:hypothetical protein [Erysipelotrichales bacterium]
MKNNYNIDSQKKNKMTVVTVLISVVLTVVIGIFIFSMVFTGDIKIELRESMIYIDAAY